MLRLAEAITRTFVGVEAAVCPESGRLLLLDSDSAERLEAARAFLVGLGVEVAQ